jgi:Thaumarchaeal output domain 1
MKPRTVRATCPSCQAGDVAISSVVHHLVCAYVGPDYDFETDEGYRCPKCLRAVHNHDPDAEIVGDSARCGLCGMEFIVPHKHARDV